MTSDFLWQLECWVLNDLLKIVLNSDAYTFKVFERCTVKNGQI